MSHKEGTLEQIAYDTSGTVMELQVRLKDLQRAILNGWAALQKAMDELVTVQQRLTPIMAPASVAS